MFKISFGSVVFALVLAEVMCWTIDLPEARKFIFEKNDHLKEYEGNHKTEISKQVFYSNREHSNSKHHEDPHHHGHHHDHDPYAKDYGYQPYMEEKVRDIVYEGSEYLEGLQRSIENYTDLLENCTRANQTNERFLFWNSTTFNSTQFNATFNVTTTPEPWRPMNEQRPYNETSFNMTERCRLATHSREHVRRLAELATKATKELQDIAYSRKYMKADPHELSKMENELILKLAWFLDRLAQYTGYMPKPSQYLHKDEYRSSTTAAPVAVSMMNATAVVTQLMMDCLKQKSDIPATIRCQYPAEIPPVVQMINNQNSMPETPASSNRNERVIRTNDQELLIATDSRPNLPHKIFKRSAEESAITFMKYFVKQKIWEADNPAEHSSKSFEEFEVNNHIRPKRDAKLKIPEDPYQDLSKYLKHKKGVNYVKDEAQAQKIRDAIFKIKNSKNTPKVQSQRISKLFRTKRSYNYEENVDKTRNPDDLINNISAQAQLKDGELEIKNSKNTAKVKSQHIPKLFRTKRSYTYEENVDKPRNPDDLFKDISYYVKNRPGTNYSSDLTQAGLLRAGLERIFLTPNIETVRRYGSNFNPLVPNPLMFGAMRSAADNL